MQSKKIKGFTLIELLIVIGITVVLSAAVILSINPAKQLEMARNNQRKTHVAVIETKIHEFRVREGFFPTCVSSSERDVVECKEDLVPIYFHEMPRDPLVIDEEESGYYVKINPQTQRVGVRAYYAEGDEIIVAGDNFEL